MFCSRCGAPLIRGDRFCHVCGAAVPSAEAGAPPEGYAGPEPDGPRRGRAAGAAFEPEEYAGPDLDGSRPGGTEKSAKRLLRSLLWLLAMTAAALVILLLATADWMRWEALLGLFRPEPAAPEPFSQAEPQSEPQPERDAAGSLVLPVDDRLVELPQAALDTAEEAAQNALQRIYGPEPMTGEAALELFCNLRAGGYASGRQLAKDLNETCTGTLNQWNGRIAGEPVIRGNRAYLSVMLYAIRGTRGAPYSFDYDILTDELLISMIWSGSEWLVDASTMAEFMLQDNYRFLCSDGFCEARDSGRACFFYLGPGILAEPVIPQVCDTLIREVYATPDGGAVISCWAWNGLGEAVDIDVLDEVFLVQPNSWNYYFHEYDYPIEPLHLEPREGRVLTLVIPPEEMEAPLDDAMSLTARVRLVDYR